YQGEEVPFNAHPRLDLFVASTSPHPAETFGCTGCHQGQDRATSFYRAAHTPTGEHTAAEWKEKYGWHELHYWEYPMHSRTYIEASCYQCHSQEIEIPEAEKLNRGRHLFEELGCAGCHKVGGFEDIPRVGPDLRKIASKTTQDWASRWIANPKGFRPTTKMPSFFHTTNRSGSEDVATNLAEIQAIVTYLFKNSETPVYPGAPSGNPVRGKALAHQVGCQGCHLVIGDPPEDQPKDYGRFGFGPNLRRIGEKTNPQWLYQWLQDPRKYHPGTRMPSLRLSTQEAADLTAYLMGLRSPADPGIPQANEEARRQALDEILTSFMRRNSTRDQVKEKISSMTEEEKNLFAGKRLIPRYGCAGCHMIAGFEDAQRIGVELTEIGNKISRKLDFGLVDIDHTLPTWLFHKMKDSRIFDLKRAVTWEEKLRMPDFALTDEEAEALVTLLMSIQKESTRPAITRILGATGEAVEAGRRIIVRRNCRGCHIIEGKGGDIQVALERELVPQGIPPEQVVAFAPPNLYREGEKVQPDWLFEFLKVPQTIRPWLNVRMPTFNFSDQEGTALARYFALADDVDFPFSSRVRETLTAVELQSAHTLFSPDYLNCLSCHQQGTRKPEGPPSGWAPDFSLAAKRLRPAWIVEWLRDPQELQPGTKMPSYFATADSGPPDVLGGDEEKQIEVLKKYLLSLGS
ncbi:MAG: c-type cytochrome, partial [Acidobacteriota bacterium]